MEPRLSLITLGVADVGRSRAFYEGLGWRGQSPDGEVVFFQTGGMAVALWDRAKLAADSAVADSGGWGGVTLAHNVRSAAEVDAVLAQVVPAGGEVARSGAPTFWGGYSGIFLDPDGHPWEVAHNPAWGPLDDGSVRLDGVAPSMTEGAVQWADVVAADAELAAHVIARLQAAPCYLATVRRDGWPRVHPVGMNVRDGDLVVVMNPRSPKRHDLERNGRFAVHGVAEDDFGGGGEVLVTGAARTRRPSQDDEAKGYVAFDLLVSEVRLVQYAGADAAPVRRRWAPV